MAIREIGLNGTLYVAMPKYAQIGWKARMSGASQVKWVRRTTLVHFQIWALLTNLPC